jgi:hypothetical protein
MKIRNANIRDNIHKIIYGKTYTQRRNDLVVMFGETAVNKAEIATSRYVGTITAKILFSKHFEASCHAGKN